MDYLICDICKLELVEKKDIIIPYHDKLYHKQCIMEEFEEQGWYTCTYCCHKDKDDFYLDNLIYKKDCITIQSSTGKINKLYNVIYRDKIYHDYCFQKYIDSILIFPNNNNSNEKAKETCDDKKSDFRGKI